MGMAPSTPTIQPVNAQQVGKNFQQMLSQLFASAPGQFAQQAQFQPQYTNLQNQNADLALNGGNGAPGFLDQFLRNVMPGVAGATANTVAGFGPQAAGAVGSISPGTTSLVDQLTRTAGSEMAAGTQLPASQVDQVLNAVNQNWSSRGLGGSPANQLDAAVQLALGGQNQLTQSQNAATGAANTGFNLTTEPALSLLGGALPTPGTSLNVANIGQGISSGAAQGSSMYTNSDLESLMNAMFNQQASINIGNANNQEAQNALKEQFWSGVISSGAGMM